MKKSQINLTLEEHQSLTRLLSATLKNKLKFDDNSTSIFKDTLDVITNDEPTFMSMTDKCFDAGMFDAQIKARNNDGA